MNADPNIFYNGAEEANKLSGSKAWLHEVSTSNHGETHEGHKEREAELDSFVESKLVEGKPWTDAEFPPNRDSLYNQNQDSLTSAEELFYSSLTWRRAS